MSSTQRLHQGTIALLALEMTNSTHRIIDLFGSLGDEQLWGPNLAIVNPARWEVGHVAWFYERWILRGLYEAEPLIKNADDLYNSAEVAHDLRWDLLLPTQEQTLNFLNDVVQQSIHRLNAVEATDRDAYFFRLGIYHADMHTEALTYTRQTLAYPEPEMRVAKASPGDLEPEPGFEPHDVAIPGGLLMLGAAPDEIFVFDNEKWAHAVELDPFRISATATTYGEFKKFVDAGGYQDRKLWTDEGWNWRAAAQVEHPAYWQADDAGNWILRRYDKVIPLPEQCAIIHVNWHEANAYCAWAGRRLPTEAEWELAASGEPTLDGRGVASSNRRYPWGQEPPTPARANLDWAGGGTIDVRALPQGDSGFGVRQMVGNVWEWTSTIFGPYPGFEPDPYKEYSEPSFGDHIVLRGGCWATRSRLIRNTWRNFYKPDRRDVMCGFRTCAV
jgi:iron(II)-dependent oxidoreductase